MVCPGSGRSSYFAEGPWPMQVLIACAFNFTTRSIFVCSYLTLGCLILTLNPQVQVLRVGTIIENSLFIRNAGFWHPFIYCCLICPIVNLFFKSHPSLSLVTRCKKKKKRMRFVKNALSGEVMCSYVLSF